MWPSVVPNCLLLSVLFRAIPCYSVPFRALKQLLIRLRLQLPGSAESVAAGLDQAQTPQQDKIVSKRAVRQIPADDLLDVPQGAALAVSKVMQDASLAFGQVVADAMRRNVAARDESDNDFPR